MKDGTVIAIPGRRGGKTQSMLKMIVKQELAYVVECPHCGITILNKDASIVKRNAEWHIRHCEFDPENKRCQTCKHFIKNLYPVRDGCALGEIIRDSDICFKHELKETKDE